MKTILVVANETLGGAPLLERIRQHAEEDDIRIAICVPQTRPRHGNIIYDEAVYDAAQVRIELARSVLRQEGIDAVGEPGDPDPYTATMDAVGDPLGLDARRSHRAREEGVRQARRPRGGRGAHRRLGDHGSRRDRPRPRRARPPRSAAGEPQLARRAPAP